MDDRIPATAEEAKALANPVRMRILRLCGEQELTNKQLAQRLDRDPSTILHHIRQLVAAGFLEPMTPRPGPTGALEKPYRSTNRSWLRDLTGAQSPELLADANLAMLEAFREELVEAGPASIVSSSRFVFHLDPDERDALMARLQAVLDEYVRSDDERKAAGKPAHGGVLFVHTQPD
ncbi:MAG: winged helix-turn-helix domain-containing protein [Actinomycetota bacterium]|nr:winged helix-turn-helix domain-containing protein [Actinomycetota bacterium]